MKTRIISCLLASALTLSTAAAQAAECLPFASGEVLCDDGTYAYYYSPVTGQWQVLDRAATMAALGLSDDGYGNDSGGTIYGSDGSLTTTDDGCMMFSSPGYSYGDSFSFSSGC